MAAVMTLSSRRPPPPIPPWKAALVNNTVIRLRSRRAGEPSQRTETNEFQIPARPSLAEGAAGHAPTEPDTSANPVSAPAVAETVPAPTVDGEGQPARNLDYTGPPHLRPEPTPGAEPPPNPPFAIPQSPAEEPKPVPETLDSLPIPAGPTLPPSDTGSTPAQPQTPAAAPTAAPMSPARAVAARLEIPSDAESLADIVRRSRASLSEIEGGYGAVLTITSREPGADWTEETIRVRAHVASRNVLMEWLDSPRSGRRLAFTENGATPVRIHLGPNEPRLLGDRISIGRDHALLRGVAQIPIVALTLEAWIASLESALAAGPRTADTPGELSFEGTRAPNATLPNLTDADAAKPHYHLVQTVADSPEVSRRDWYIDTERMLPTCSVLSNANGEPLEIHTFSDITFERDLAADALRLD